MFLLYFNNNNNEIFIYILIIIIIIAIVTSVAIVDKINQNKPLRKIDAVTDFYSLLNNDYFLNYDKIEEEAVIDKIRASIRYFNAIQFKIFVSDAFLKYIEAFTKSNADIILQLSSHECIKVVKSMIDTNSKENYSVFTENYKHNLIQITNYASIGDNEEIYVSLYFTTKLYTLDANKKLLYGNPHIPYDFKADLKFTLKTSIKNNPTTYMTPKTNCPKCSNILTLTKSGTCKFCDLDIQGGYSHWVLDSFDISSSVVLDTL